MILRRRRATLTITKDKRSRIPWSMVLIAIVAGALIGTFQIANTSVGWHQASGRWVITNGTVPRHDPFSFTSNDAEWVDHEWLFQTGVAVIADLGGARALSLARSLAVAALTVLLLVFGIRSGLSPPMALLLAVACVAGSRPRFFLRPELVTLLVVPLAVWIFQHRDNYISKLWLGLLAGLMVLGANAHGGALVVPILLTGILVAEMGEMTILGHFSPQAVKSGILGIVTATGALLVNPYGWRLFVVPFRLTELVDQPHIPNPEWIPPTVQSTPALFVVIVAATLILGFHERRACRWSLFIMAVGLAMRHIRNMGLFYVLLPLAVAPSLARWRFFAVESEASTFRRGGRALAALAALVLAASVAASSWPVFGLGYAAGYYPSKACDFLDAENLPHDQLYNDVRFGGYLINRYGPDRGVFQDDRNEIHDALLRDIWEIFGRSDVASWSALLEHHGADTALVKYHPAIMVTTPDGKALGERGFSALWFPSTEWALVYWDDIAMVFVRRATASKDLLAAHEYPVIRPDDLEYLLQRIGPDPELKARVALEVERALNENPGNGLARRLARSISRITDP